MSTTIPRTDCSNCQLYRHTFVPYYPHLFCDLSVDVCVENESSSAISATTNQQSSTGLHIQLKDETKSAEAAKLPVEFVAKVFV